MHSMRSAAAALGLAAALAAAPAAARAQVPVMPAPQNVVSLDASASVEVERDVLSVAFSTTREGNDPQTVQNQLKQALDAALAEARKAAKPGQVDVRTGNFSLSPRYVPNKGVSGWQGSTELIVEGKDVQAISQLTGRIGTLTVQRVNFALSREAREKVENEVVAAAIAKFRAKADFTAKQFGFGGWSVREVAVSTNDAEGVRPLNMRASAAMADAAPLPVEAGKANVTASVNGSIQLSAK